MSEIRANLDSELKRENTVRENPYSGKWTGKIDTPAIRSVYLQPIFSKPSYELSRIVGLD